MIMTGAALVERVLAIEIAAARLEGAFAADPALGRLWRAGAALTEAVRSVGLEDIRITEAELALRTYAHRVTDLEAARGGEAAEGFLAVLASPGNVFSDPQRVVARCLRAGLRDQEDEAGEAPDAAALGAAIAGAVRSAPGPLLAALRGTVLLRRETGTRIPSAERLLFLAIDHAWRSGRAGRGELAEGAGAEAILAASRAGWILAPATALTGQGLRAWSPMRREGVESLLDGLERETGRALGQLPLLRRWRAQAMAAASGRHGKSRLADAVTVLMRQPIVTGASLGLALGATPRTGLNLLAELEAGGLVENLVPRRTYRAWAPAPLARRILGDAHAGAGGRPVRDPAPGQRRPFPEAASGDGDALAELEAALARADGILARYPQG